MHGVGVNERDLEAEEAALRSLVDQLRALRLELTERLRDVVYLVGDVMHSRPALGEKLPDGRFRAERGQQLDSSLADPHRRSLDALVRNRLAVLELGAEEALVGRNGLIEVGDGNAQMMNPPGLHAAGCYSA